MAPACLCLEPRLRARTARRAGCRGPGAAPVWRADRRSSARSEMDGAGLDRGGEVGVGNRLPDHPPRRGSAVTGSANSDGCRPPIPNPVGTEYRDHHASGRYRFNRLLGGEEPSRRGFRLLIQSKFCVPFQLRVLQYADNLIRPAVISRAFQIQVLPQCLEIAVLHPRLPKLQEVFPLPGVGLFTNLPSAFSLPLELLSRHAWLGMRRGVASGVETIQQPLAMKAPTAMTEMAAAPGAQPQPKLAASRDDRLKLNREGPEPPQNQPAIRPKF